MHFKFRAVIDAEEYECGVHAWYISPVRDVFSSESRDLFIFWEISNNISETVQDRDIVTMED